MKNVVNFEHGFPVLQLLRNQAYMRVEGHLMAPTPTYSKVYALNASVIGFLSNYPLRTVQCVRAALNTIALSHAS